MSEETDPPVEEECDYKDKYLRLLADGENTRRRMQKERVDMTRFGIENVLSELLGPIDHFENGLRFADQASEEVKNWAVGFQMILTQFQEILTRHGVTSFSSEGERFDGTKHEIIEVEERGDVSDGTILKEFTKGYRRGDRILRAARVKVAKRSTIEGESDHEQEKQ